METIFFKGNKCHTYGTLPKVGETAPCFHLVSSELKEVSCHDFKGKRIVLNIFPSLDTEVCANSVRRFNKEASKMKDTVVICVSMDLPFAAQRFCTANGIDNVIVTSAFRSPSFWEKYGIKIIDGPLAGLLARSVVVIDKDQKVVSTQLVEEITNEPLYDNVLEMLQQ